MNGSKAQNAINWEKVKLQCEIMVAVSTVIAVAIGGFWVLFRFVALKELEIAEANASKSSSRLNIEIVARQAETIEGTCIFADVTLTNVGIKPVYVSSRRTVDGRSTYNAPLAAYKVSFGEHGDLVTEAGKNVFGKRILGHPLTVPATEKKSSTVTWDLIRVGESRKIPFAMRIPEPGVYLVAYRNTIDLTTEEKAVYKEVIPKGSISDDKLPVVSARTYVVVNDGKFPKDQSSSVAAKNRTTEEEEEEEEE